MMVKMSKALAKKQVVLDFDKDRSAKTKRKFAPKVRSGCDVCKKRRIKCDEKRPSCERCLNGSFKCVYNVPMAKYFLSRQTALLDTTGLNIIAPSIPSNYGNDEEVRSLGFFLRRTAPMLSIAMGATEFWNILVAQSSWEYPEVKHILVAISLLDQNLVRSDTSISPDGDFGPALIHYNKGLAVLRERKSSIMCVLISSILAWMFEFVTGHHELARLHIKASKSIKEECETGVQLSTSSDQQLLFTTVDTCLWKANMLNLMMPPHLTYTITTLDEARSRLLEIYGHLAVQDLTSETIRIDIQKKLNSWRRAFEMFRFLSPGEMPIKRRLYLLHNIGITYIHLFHKAACEGKVCPQRWHGLLNDIENIVEYEGLTELNRALLLVLDLFTLHHPVQSQYHARALKLREEIWRRQEMGSNQTQNL